MALKHLKRLFFIVFLFSVSVIHGASIDTINGIVTDAVSKKAVESVDVSSEGVTTKTGADGKFSLLIRATDVHTKDKHELLIRWNAVRGKPYAFYGDSANIRAEGNIEDNVKAANRVAGVRGGAEPFPDPAPYQYMLHSADQVKELVMKCAGPQ